MSRPLRVLFVCTGNLCRSPTAAAIAAAEARARGIALEVDSAGTLGLQDQPAPRNTVAAARERGLDLGAHRSKGLDAELVAWADRVLVMELAHSVEVRERFPEVGAKLALLGPYGGQPEIDDPMGGWMQRHRVAYEAIHRAVVGFLRSLDE